MTLAILELSIAGISLWCAIKCVQFWPALAGRQEPGTHCSGSLVALATGIVGYGLSGFLKKLLTGIGIGAAAGAAAKGGGGSGGAGEEPAPAEPAPAEPSVPDVPPVIPEGVSYSSQTGGGSTASLTGGDYSIGNSPTTATKGQAGAFAALA